MKITVLEEKKNRLLFRVEGADHTICNALRDELSANSDVKSAGYHVDHPQMGVPEFLVETSQGTEARKAVMDALKKLHKTVDSLGKQAEKLK